MDITNIKIMIRTTVIIVADLKSAVDHTCIRAAANKPSENVNRFSILLESVMAISIWESIKSKHFSNWLLVMFLTSNYFLKIEYLVYKCVFIEGSDSSNWFSRCWSNSMIIIPEISVRADQISLSCWFQRTIDPIQIMTEMLRYMRSLRLARCHDSKKIFQKVDSEWYAIQTSFHCFMYFFHLHCYWLLKVYLTFF